MGGPRGGLILSSCGDEEIYKKLQSSVFPANQGGPLVHIIAAKAVCFKEALEPQYKEYQANVIKMQKQWLKYLNNVVMTLCQMVLKTTCS